MNDPDAFDLEDDATRISLGLPVWDDPDAEDHSDSSVPWGLPRSDGYLRVHRGGGA